MHVWCTGSRLIELTALLLLLLLLLRVLLSVAVRTSSVKSVWVD